MLTKSLLQKISELRRKVLIAHVGADGPMPYRPVDGNAISGLLHMKLLRYVNGGRATVLTELGREAACVVLAEYAEALILAGAGHSPLEQLLAAQTPAERAREMKKLISARLEQSEPSPQTTEIATETPNSAISAQ